MNERKIGMLRIHADSIIKAIYGNTDYKAVSIRISKDDRRMLEITVSHPNLPEYKKGHKLPEVTIERKYGQDEG